MLGVLATRSNVFTGASILIIPTKASVCRATPLSHRSHVNDRPPPWTAALTKPRPPIKPAAVRAADTPIDLVHPSPCSGTYSGHCAAMRLYSSSSISMGSCSTGFSSRTSATPTAPAAAKVCARVVLRGNTLEDGGAGLDPVVVDCAVLATVPLDLAGLEAEMLVPCVLSLPGLDPPRFEPTVLEPGLIAPPACNPEETDPSPPGPGGLKRVASGESGLGCCPGITPSCSAPSRIGRSCSYLVSGDIRMSSPVSISNGCVVGMIVDRSMPGILIEATTAQRHDDKPLMIISQPTAAMPGYCAPYIMARCRMNNSLYRQDC